ncbi:peptidoglycan-binding protein [uncultured Parvibaculum sp.]|uniref:peptidoglycan-binding protein n=1 Tax=uncultured Parvibaculum sp. TaxID=291828 RepID=UPI0030ECAD25|tara:strand:+ start:26565 stop:27497 length:933 start_codon:yes stop_codon:yes gene_type:complete
MLTELQKQTAKAIVNVFETGQARGDYGRVTLLAGDSGHLTYGMAQTTLGSGNLYLLIKAYCAAAGAAYAAALKPYLQRLADIDLRLDNDMTFRGLLTDAGADPVMQEAQENFFDRVFWRPSAEAASKLGLAEALSHAIIYDSTIHGAWAPMRDRTLVKMGQPGRAGEHAWIAAYVRERRNWLATHPNRLLGRTVYRMDAFETLIGAKNWQLALPVTVRGVRIEPVIFDYRPPVPVSAVDAATRNLRLTTPHMTGADVRSLEEALAKEGYAINVDGVFDEGLERALKSFQQEYGLFADGIAGPATRMMLGL